MKILRQDKKIDLTQLSFTYTWQTLGKIYIGNELQSGTKIVDTLV